MAKKQTTTAELWVVAGTENKIAVGLPSYISTDERAKAKFKELANADRITKPNFLNMYAHELSVFKLGTYNFETLQHTNLEEPKLMWKVTDLLEKPKKAKGKK